MSQLTKLGVGPTRKQRSEYDFCHFFAFTSSENLAIVSLFSSSKNNGLVTQPLTLSHHRVNARLSR